MFAVLGEDKSDVEMLNTLIRRIANKPNMTIKKMGYNGCAEMIIKGARQLRTYEALGCTRFIICYDSDGKNARQRHEKIVTDVIKKSGVNGKFCALVPVQEIESWILADLDAVTKIIPSWRPTETIHHPESRPDPKEYLEKLSRTAQNKPLYSHSLHNPKVAQFLDLRKIAEKCPSSLPLFEIVTMGNGNHPPLPRAESEELHKQILTALRL